MYADNQSSFKVCLQTVRFKLVKLAQVTAVKKALKLVKGIMQTYHVA